MPIEPVDAVAGAGHIEQLWKWTVGFIALVGAWIWNHSMGRLQKLETDKLDTKIFDDRMERLDDDRREAREDLIARFDSDRQETRQSLTALAKMQEQQGRTLARIEGSMQQRGHRE